MRRRDDPFDDIFREIERMMNDMMGMGTEGSFTPKQSTPQTHVDIHEDGDDVRVIADLPGVPKESIDLQCDGDTLTIQAHSGNREYDERVRLPVRVDEHSASATYNNGVLEVVLQRADVTTNIDVE